MPFSSVLAVFKWTAVAATVTSAVLWASFDGLALQPPAPTSDCQLDVVASTRQKDFEPMRPHLGCEAWPAS